MVTLTFLLFQEILRNSLRHVSILYNMNNAFMVAFFVFKYE